jgi:hypothetical protein
MLSSTVDNKANSYQALVESRVDSPGAEQSDHGIMDLEEAGRTSCGKLQFSHCSERRDAQANRSTTTDDVLGEFYD